jgi:hypothetical protein
VFQPNVCSCPESLLESVKAEDDDENEIADVLGVVLVHAQVYFAGQRNLVFNQLSPAVVFRNFFQIFRFLVNLKMLKMC